MKVKMAALTLCVFIFAMNFNVFAGEWTPPGYISFVDDYFVNNIRVWGLDLSENPANCSDLSIGATLVNRNRTEVKAKTALAILLSALVSGKRIAIKLADNECDPDGSPVFYAIRIMN